MKAVTVDPNSGFCFGVVYAIQMAEDWLDENGSLYCLGDIVHNEIEVQRLQQKGLKIISHEELVQLRDTAVLIRAHGEPPETYQTAMKNNIMLIDASCPVVLKLQNRVRNAYNDEEQVVIYGKNGHAEVNGLVGQTNGKAIVIAGEEGLEQLDYDKPISLFSQTTKSTSNFYHLKSLIEERAKNSFKANDTICRQVSNREPHLKVFAKQYDTVIFVSGKKSSNGKVLYEVCKQENPNTYFISSPEELNPEWLKNSYNVGICGATSTPMWLMEDVKTAIQQILENTKS